MTSRKVKFRSMLVADKGHVLVSCDLSQAESWVVAYLADDPQMKLALRKGIIHELTASRLYNIPIESVTKTQRYAGKQCNHAFAYRMEPHRHMEVVNAYSRLPPYITISMAAAQHRSKVWHQLYTCVSGRWWQDVDSAILRTRTLHTPYGRVRKFYGDLREGSGRKATFKEATAYIPQSTVADHTFGAIQPELAGMGAVERFGIRGIYKALVLCNGARIVNTSHDSITCEVPYQRQIETAEQMIAAMKRPLLIRGEEFTIPVECEIGEDYGSMEKLDLEAVTVAKA
jgi:DNA polymerase I-like protein with 3'-5' exonuclease and polymerase domains